MSSGTTSDPGATSAVSEPQAVVVTSSVGAEIDERPHRRQVVDAVGRHRLRLPMDREDLATVDLEFAPTLTDVARAVEVEPGAEDQPEFHADSTVATGTPAGSASDAVQRGDLEREREGDDVGTGGFEQFAAAPAVPPVASTSSCTTTFLPVSGMCELSSRMFSPYSNP